MCTGRVRHGGWCVLVWGWVEQYAWATTRIGLWQTERREQLYEPVYQWLVRDCVWPLWSFALLLVRQLRHAASEPVQRQRVRARTGGEMVGAAVAAHARVYSGLAWWLLRAGSPWVSERPPLGQAIVRGGCNSASWGC
jgi:hypothetical protein